MQWRAVLGSSSRNSSTTSFNVARFTFHPSYNVLSLFDADVAIVHLASSAELSQTINTAAVASATSVVFPGLPVTSIGWGSGVIISQLSSIITNKKLDSWCRIVIIVENISLHCAIVTVFMDILENIFFYKGKPFDFFMLKPPMDTHNTSGVTNALLAFGKWGEGSGRVR